MDERGPRHGTTRLQRLLDALATRAGEECLVWRSASYSCGDLEEKRLEWAAILRDKGIAPGTVVGLKARYSPAAIGLLLALLSHRCIVALVPHGAVDDDVYVEDGQIECLFRLSDSDEWSWTAPAREVDHPLLHQLRASGTGGFIIFSSGSTGKPKAVLHSVERFLAKFESPGKNLRTLAFLLLDHIAGMDTLFYTLCGGGVLVLTERMDPRSVCRLIEEHRVEVLPVSPTFLNMLCLSGDYVGFDLSSLKIVTYGSEPMSQFTLDRLGEILPGVKFIQKYGTSEFGAPRARSRGNDSLWLKLKSDEVEAKVVDGVLWVRTEIAMLGYLNAPSPIDDEGWLCTGDLVETDGDWIRILGRKSDIIIVGGEKVYPQEVEAVLLELDFVRDAAVRGEQHSLMGHIVTARLNLARPLDEGTVRREVRKHCRARLEPHKVPARVEVADAPLTTDRQKRIRRG